MKGLALFLASIWGDATNDQAKCQAEANFMAKHKWFAHCGPTIGKFEGVGWGKCEKPKTCEPDESRGLKVTGDATAKTADGIIVRVRSWR
jgi:hypothetical protein